MTDLLTRWAPALAGLALAFAPQAFSQQKPKMVEDVFKNVQALKGISVDDFLGTMGVMSAAIGFDCSECHNNAGTERVDWAADDNPKKLTARRMVRMVQAINRDHFNNRQEVTCWTCHHGRDRPAVTPSLETVYGQVPLDPDDVLQNMPGQTPATQIFDKYLTALGGADKLNSLQSWIGTGTSVGFGGFGGGGEVTIYAKAPNQRTTWIQFKKETERPDSIRLTNGKTAWIKTPLAVLTEYQLTGNELSGAIVDAMLSFPGQIKTIFTNLKSPAQQTISDLPGPSSQTDSEKSTGIGQDHAVNVVQGTGPGNTLTTMYFDPQTNLLLRIVRYTATPIGRVPTEMDLADYRDIGNGIKLPFRLTFAWLDGRDAIQLDRVQVNPAIPESKFNTPESLRQ